MQTCSIQGVYTQRLILNSVNARVRGLEMSGGGGILSSLQTSVQAWVNRVTQCLLGAQRQAVPLAAVLGEEHQHIEKNFNVLKSQNIESKQVLCLSSWKMLRLQNNSLPPALPALYNYF